MEYRQLGQSSLLVSAIAYGNWLTHGEGVDGAIATACVREALDSGITTFDTADVYADGHAEELLGTALVGVRRESVVICTKVGLPVGPGPQDQGLSRQHVIDSCHASLRRLRAGHIDLYQAHRFDEHTPLEETFAAFAELVRAGDVCYVGVSEWTPAQLCHGKELAMQCGLQLISNQPQYSAIWRVPEAEVIPMCARQGIGLIAYSPLAQGVLAGRYPPDRTPAADSRYGRLRRGGSISRYLSRELRSRVEALRPIAAAAGISLAQLAVAWVLQNPNISSAIIGASRPAQVAENAAAAYVRLDAEVMSSIDLAIGDIVERDPGKAGRPYDVMPRWRAAEP
jgi:aryl-alcohol dehydrogenase-like predicted oxidoreductase